MIAVKGAYKFTRNNKTIISGENLITLLGESFFMNRWLNDEFKPIQNIVFGTGTSRQVKTDTKLAKQKLVKTCNSKVDLKTKQVILECDCTPNEILGTSEIGVTNGETLISRDVYGVITEELIGQDNTSNIHIEYTFNVSTGGIRSNWTLSTNSNDIYYIYEPNTVTGVTESNTDSGYSRKNSIEELVNGSYYYDNNSKNLYIKTTKADDPNNYEIIILTR